MNKILIQFKREFWESRTSFIRVPLYMSAILVVLLLLGIAPAQFKLERHLQENVGEGHEMHPEFLHQLKSGEFFSIHPDMLTHGFATIYTLFTIVLLLVLSFYFVDALYNDRRDQSVLFWKSLPVSEHRNVLTKLAAGIGGASLVYAAAALVTGAFFLLIFMVYGGVFWHLPLPGLGEVLVTYLASTVGLVLGWWLLVLWMLPVFCWLLFSSALAKKAPFLMALGIPLALVVFEGWVLGSAHMAGIIKDQIVTAFLGFQDVLHKPGQLCNQLIHAITAPAMWLGLLLSALLLTGSIWLRSNRWEI